MNELITLVEEVLSRLTDISLTLNEISGKLDSISGVYGIDDVVAKLENATDEIVGDTR